MRTVLLLCCLLALSVVAAQPVAPAAADTTGPYLLSADRLFDGEQVREGWAILVEGERIKEVGPLAGIRVPAHTKKLHFPKATILPGLIEGHSHMFLYPYEQRSWDEQVLKETDAMRAIRATQHARATLLAGFTTARDMGTEGAGYADVDLREAIDRGIVPGPRLLVAGRAIVATGAYGPKGYDSDNKIMLGAQEADGDQLIRVTREQMGHGTDLVKIYADYHWGKGKEDLPTFSEEELRLVVKTARSGGRPVAAHAGSAEGMRRAILAGVETIEHGDDMTDSIAQLIRQKGVVYIPTLAATESICRYQGWKKGKDPAPEWILQKKKGFQTALRAGVKIGMGGDVGVFAHGSNILEMELMQEYGMSALEVLKAATSVNADAFHQQENIGRLKAGLFADLIVVTGDPTKQVSACRQLRLVMKGGKIYFSGN